METSVPPVPAPAAPLTITLDSLRAKSALLGRGIQELRNSLTGTIGAKACLDQLIAEVEKANQPQK